ncbi:MAG: TonB-dependent receptor [Myxococcaceae bacterium]|nr:MAG: TonB-dependent receptor [Myxococcaceae bacterium]
MARWFPLRLALCLPAALAIGGAVPAAFRFAWAQPLPRPPADAGPVDGAPTPVSDGGPDAGVPPELVPPVMRETAHPTYPQDGDGHPVRVLLMLTVSPTGDVIAAETLGLVPAGAPVSFERSAREAILRMRFHPAQRAGEPVAVRLRFHLTIAPPVVELGEGPATDAATASAPGAPAGAGDAGATPSDAPPDAGGPVPVGEATVVAHAVEPPRAASDFVIDHDLMTAAPHQSAGDLLASAPGVYVSRPEGDAVAHQVFLRGFDAEHGQDIQFSLGVVPINLPSHLHGQGYADLNFIIPETVRSLRVTEGIYDPRQGDFAVAGSVHFDLGVARRGVLLRAGYGSFGTVRALAMWAPRGEATETFAAFTYRASEGFGRNRGSQSGGAIAQYVFRGPAGFRATAHFAGYGARAGLAGVLRRGDVEQGRVDFYGAYPDPSASAQSALSTRAQASVALERRSDRGALTTFAAWFARTDFRSRVNFTGYTQRSRVRPDWVGRGDLIEQANGDTGFGALASHRTPRYELTPWWSAAFEGGVGVRYDLIEQAQNLLQAPQNETWDRRVDATLRASDIGLYLDADLRITRAVRVRGGVRADVLHYDIDDRLGNFTPAFQRESHIVGFRRTALGLALGPRATVEVSPFGWLKLFASYGEGYRSPQARQLEEGEGAPFARVRSVEAGFHARTTDGRERLSFRGAAYATYLSTDLAFDPQEGRLEPIGPTRRVGLVGHLIARPWPWALASLSVTWVYATLEAPPPATAANPSPPYTPGQLLPYVPPVVARADARVERDLVRIRGHALVGRAGAGFTFLSPRPLPFGQFADPVALLDVSASVRWRAVEAGVECFNLLDARYAATEYSFASDWQTRTVPSRVPARHLSAGPPLTALGTLTLHL